MKLKHLEISEIIERRIRQGDYGISGLPAERDLADDVGASRVTVRKALAILEQKGLLHRAANRRMVLTEVAVETAGSLQLAFVAPSTPDTGFSLDLQRWQAAVEGACRKANANMRIVHYHHWDDPVLAEALRAYDGVLLVTSSEPIPSQIQALLRRSGQVACLSDDLTSLGIPSIVLFPHSTVGRILDHLLALGHRRVDCFNVQGHNAVTEARIQCWKGWLNVNSIGGDLLDDPCDVDTAIFDFALATARRRLSTLHPATTAVFGVTLPAAMGLMRAAADAGIRIGDELSVCVLDGEGIATHLVPSLTSFQPPQLSGCLSAVIDWFAAGGDPGDWIGPLLLEPSQLTLFEGESTRSPAFTKASTAARP